MEKIMVGIMVGQTLWANPEGPNSARNGDKEPIEVVVETIGKKYLTVKRKDGSWLFNKKRFYVETLIEDGGNYSAGWRLYRSAQEIQDKKEAAIIKDFILGVFSWGGVHKSLSLEQLRRIKAIVDEPKSNS